MYRSAEAWDAAAMDVRHETASVYLFARFGPLWRLGMIEHPRHDGWVILGVHQARALSGNEVSAAPMVPKAGLGVGTRRARTEPGGRGFTCGAAHGGVGRQTPIRVYVPVPSCLPLEYWRMNSPSAYRSWPIMEPVYLFCTPIFELPGTSR